MSILYDMRSGTLVKSKLFNNGLDLKDALTFNPLSLFKDGKQGVWYDPSDKSTLFQDVAGTVPVTKDGDPVALMRDKSGNGNHATQSVSTARPIYKTDGILRWLQFDGVDDVLNIPVQGVIGNNNRTLLLVLSKSEDLVNSYDHYVGGYPNDTGINMTEGLPNNSGQMRVVTSTSGGVALSEPARINNPTSPNIYKAYINLEERKLLSEINEFGKVEVSLGSGELTNPSSYALMGRGRGAQVAKGSVYDLIIVDRLIDDNAYEYLNRKISG